MIEKLVPCAFCGEKPLSAECFDDGWPKTAAHCRNGACFLAYNLFWEDDWNKIQASLLAQRRKDFNAGVEWSFENMFRSDTHDSQYFDKYLEKEQSK